MSGELLIVYSKSTGLRVATLTTDAGGNYTVGLGLGYYWLQKGYACGEAGGACPISGHLDFSIYEVGWTITLNLVDADIFGLIVY